MPWGTCDLNLCEKKHVFANNFHAFSAYLPNKYVHLCTSRQTKFEGVSKSPVVGYNDVKQHILYLAIGWSPSGENSGNTVTNTHRVLQIVKTAMKERGNHGDGGWKSALTVSFYLDHVYFCTNNKITLVPHTAHTVCIFAQEDVVAYRHSVGLINSN